MDKPGLTTDSAGQTHCTWRTAAPEYPRYHDAEWGVPVADDIQPVSYTHLTLPTSDLV